MDKEKKNQEIQANAEAILDPAQWFEKGNALLYAAKKLNPKLNEWLGGRIEGGSDDGLEKAENIHPTYLMLIGYAIENFVKASMVCKLSDDDRAKVKCTGSLPKRFKGHCSKELIVKGLGKSQFDELSSDMGDSLIEKISDAVIWKGRYPSKVRPRGVLYSPEDGEYMGFQAFTDVDFAMEKAKEIKELVEKKIGPRT